MTTRNLLESDHAALPWLLVPAFFGAFLALAALAAASPIAAGIFALALAAVLTISFVRMGRRS